jgi:hypothetical protein
VSPSTTYRAWFRTKKAGGYDGLGALSLTRYDTADCTGVSHGGLTTGTSPGSAWFVISGNTTTAAHNSILVTLRVSTTTTTFTAFVDDVLLRPM